MGAGKLAGTDAFWRDEGFGATEIFLLHCTLGHSGAWKGVMQPLHDTCHMIAMDLPAHGRSGPRDAKLTWQTQSTLMAIELLEAGKTPVAMVGHSFGATVALRIAVERPDLVQSLTLIDPVFFSAAKDAGRAEFQEHIEAHGEFYALLENCEFLDAARAFTSLWGGIKAWETLPKSQQDYMAERIEMIKIGGQSIFGLGPDYIPLSRVGELNLPVLLVDGELSDPIIGAVQQSLLSVLKNARRVTVEGAGHMVPITHPGPVVDAMRDFLNL